MTRRLMPLLALLAIATLAAFAAPAAGPRGPTHLTARATRAPADSLRYVLTWQQAPDDGNGTIDGYLETVTATRALGPLPTGKLIAGTHSDSFTVAKPAIGDSATFTASVRTTRRGLVSAASTISWKYKRGDVAPNPPGAITVDSSRIVSMRILFSEPGLVAMSAVCAALPRPTQIDSATGLATPACRDGRGQPMVIAACALDSLASGVVALGARQQRGNAACRRLVDTLPGVRADVVAARGP